MKRNGNTLKGKSMLKRKEKRVILLDDRRERKRRRILGERKKGKYVGREGKEGQ